MIASPGQTLRLLKVVTGIIAWIAGLTANAGIWASDDARTRTRTLRWHDL